MDRYELRISEKKCYVQYGKLRYLLLLFVIEFVTYYRTNGKDGNVKKYFKVPNTAVYKNIKSRRITNIII